MMLIEQTSVPVGALPVQDMKNHLRLGTGFADDGTQDALVESYLRAAMAVIEGRIGKALMARRFLWKLENWRWAAEQALPLAPVTGIVSVTLVDGAGVPLVVTPGRYRLAEDMHRPRLVAREAVLPAVPEDGRVEVVFDAGFGASWTALPKDLLQAWLLLTAEFYERRHDVDGHTGGLPFAVQALIERWRSVRVLGGGAQ
ncbi:MAG: head-tail connector protein [Paracoccaceae bacterium]